VEKSKRKLLLTNKVQSTQFNTLAHNASEVANIFERWDKNITESDDEDGTCEEDDESDLDEEDDEESASVNQCF